LSQVPRPKAAAVFFGNRNGYLGTHSTTGTAKQIKTHKKYTPQDTDVCIPITPEFIHILKYLEENPGEQFYKAIEAIDDGQKYPADNILKSAGLISYHTYPSGIYTNPLENSILNRF